MRCDICKGEIKIGGSYFIDKAGKNVCERTCFPDLNIGYINLPMTGIEPNKGEDEELFPGIITYTLPPLNKEEIK